MQIAIVEAKASLSSSRHFYIGFFLSILNWICEAEEPLYPHLGVCLMHVQS